jgi:hypothetical protein
MIHRNLIEKRITTFKKIVCRLILAGETNLSRELVNSKTWVFRFSVVSRRIRTDFAFSPELQGCYAQSDTYEEALENI